MSDRVPESAPNPAATFGTLLVDGGNRVAVAAARRAAESPGRSYNPLVVCGPAGVGKTHLLHAISRQARDIEAGAAILYEPIPSLVERLTNSIAAGTLSEFRAALAGLDILLLDDLQHAAGMARTQEELSIIMDEMLARGCQIVVTSDGPPHEIPAFDGALAARLATGLVVDVAPAEEETRLALSRRFLGEFGVTLSAPVVEALAALPIQSAHALKEAVQRLVDETERAGAEPLPNQVPELVGHTPVPAGEEDEFGGFLSDISTAVAAVVETAPWRRRVARAILRWEGEGIRTRRLEAALDADSAPDVDELLDGFARDVARLRQIRSEIAEDAADPALFADPDRLSEAEALTRPARTPATPPELPRPRGASAVDRWFLDREKIAWDWLALDDRLVEEKG